MVPLRAIDAESEPLHGWEWPPLDACAPASRARLERACQRIELKRDEPLLITGEPSTRVIIVREGVLRVFHKDAKREFTVKLLAAPNAVGVLEAAIDVPWAASVESLTSGVAVVIPASELREVLRTDADLARATLGNLAGKFVGTIAMSRALGFEDAETRSLRVLNEYATHFGRPIPGGVEVRFPLSRNRLVRETGLARRSVDRALESLGRAGLVTLSAKGWLELRELPAVQARLAALS